MTPLIHGSWPRPWSRRRLAHACQLNVCVYGARALASGSRLRKRESKREPEVGMLAMANAL